MLVPLKAARGASTAGGFTPLLRPLRRSVPPPYSTPPSLQKFTSITVVLRNPPKPENRETAWKEYCGCIHQVVVLQVNRAVGVIGYRGRASQGIAGK